MYIFQTRDFWGSYFGDHLTFNICFLFKTFQNTNPDTLRKLSILYFQDTPSLKGREFLFMWSIRNTMLGVRKLGFQR